MKNNCKIYLVAFLLMFNSNNIYSQWEEEWARTYSSAVYNEVSDIKADKVGNVFVTGFSNYFTTIKYDKYGVQQWVAKYTQATGSSVRSHLVLDTLGNVYVAGVTNSGSATRNDYTTIKYNSNGIESWSKRYDNSNISMSNDGATSIDIVPWGYTFVTGYSSDSVSAYDYATIMYESTSGGQGWVSRYNNGGDDKATSVKVHLNGNIFVTGYSQGSGTGYDIATIRYNTSGIQQWVARYNGPGNSSDAGNAMAIDNGNVYVTGYSYGSGTGKDFITIKYNSSGVQQWIARYNGSFNGDDEAISIAVDNSGSVIVSGNSAYSSTGKEFVTIKYTSYGTEEWIVRDGVSNPDRELKAMTIDNTGNVYLTGLANLSSIITLKYDSSGGEVWGFNYNRLCTSPPYCYYDRSSSIAVDRFQNVYVGGNEMFLHAPAPTTFLTLKYTGVIDTTIDTGNGNGHKYINLTCLIEGFYNEQTNSIIEDTLSFELRSIYSPFNIIDYGKLKIKSNGKGFIPLVDIHHDSSYYMVIKHRNSIETWSSSGLFFDSDSISYDFTLSQSKAFGNNLILKGERYCIYSGEVNRDGVINLDDILLTSNDASNFVTGYKNSDVTGDNVVNLDDVVLTFNNSNRFVSVIKP